MGEFERVLMAVLRLEDDAYGGEIRRAVAKHSARDIAAALHVSYSALRSMASGLVTELEALAARAGRSR